MTKPGEQDEAREFALDADELLAALEERDARPIEVARIEVPGLAGKGGQAFSFRVRPLSFEEMARVKLRNSHWVAGPNGRPIEQLRETELGADVIIAATVPEDRAQLWDNQQLRARLGVTKQVDMVTRLFPRAGDVNTVVETINRLSGLIEDREDRFKSPDQD